VNTIAILNVLLAAPPFTLGPPVIIVPPFETFVLDGFALNTAVFDGFAQNTAVFDGFAQNTAVFDA
jgi:hypothetical protein